MAYITRNNVAESTTVAGTGDITPLGAVTGAKTFGSVCSVGDTFPYRLAAVDANGNETGDWENGIGTYLSASAIGRTIVKESSNSNALVNFSVGNKRLTLALDDEITKNISQLMQLSSTLFIPEPGTVFDQAITTVNSGSFVCVANRLEISPLPFLFNNDVSISNIGVSVTTGVASAGVKVLIYEGDAVGKPDLKLYESPELVADTAVFISDTPTTPISLKRGKFYWVGTWSSSTPTLRGIAPGASKHIGIQSVTSNAYCTCVRRTVAYNAAANSAPVNWTYNAAERAVGTIVSVRLTVA